MNSTANTEIRVEDLAKTAVEKLAVCEIFYIHEEDFNKTIIEAHEHARDALKDSDLVFFADIIPWVASIIQLFVKRPNYLEAITWVRGAFPKSDKPESVLTVLTAVYLIQKGYEKAFSSPEEEIRKIWTSIRGRLGNLLG